jgi:hypothetical protein
VPFIFSPIGLLDVFQAGFEPASGHVGALCFLIVKWCGETLYGPGVQGVEILILLGSFFLPSVAPASLQNF